MTTTIEASGARSQTVTGSATLFGSGASFPAGIFVVVVSIDVALTAGDSFIVALADSLDAGTTTPDLWRSDTIDSTTDATLMVISPPTPIVTDGGFGAFRLDATVAVGPIDFHYKLLRIGDLTP